MTGKQNDSIRGIIDDIVASIVPFDPLEMEQVKFVRNWIQSGEEIFRIAKPATPDTHLVSYFAVISPAEKKILLVDHRQARLWLPPGGHVEPNEHPKETVEREVKEELGIEADFLFPSPLFLTVTKTSRASCGIGHTDVSLWYILKGTSQQQFEFDKDEFKQIKWFGLEEIPLKHSDPHMSRFISKLLKYNIL